MKGKKLNLIDLTQKINQFRMEHQGKSYTRQELVNEMYNLGLNKAMAPTFIANLTLSEKIGTSKIYMMPKDPIHKSQIEALYKHYNILNKARANKKSVVNTDATSSEEAIIEYLKSKGYQIRKPVGFDEQKFAQMNPELYSRFIKYETL